jgi:peroxiredoxin
MLIEREILSAVKRRMFLSSRRWLFDLSVVLLFLTAVVGLCGCGGGEDPQTIENTGNVSSASAQLEECPKEGCLAPSFTIPDLTGKPVSLSDFKGKVVLLNIWATWCGPCKREIPSLDRLYHMRKDKGLEIVAVSVDRTPVSGVATFVANYQMSFPVLHDNRGEVGQKYWAKSIPSSFLLDKNGVIKWKVIGSIEWDEAQVISRIDQILNQ